ncbi:MAG: hypothetical protein RMA76_29150 [Deltaproteobacteria bacterium]|jgi:hypothetical protein
MSDARATVALIQEFVGLAMERRKRALPVNERTRMEVLDEAIREAIDGAKPAPKRIANPTAAPGSAPSAPAATAAPKPSMASALTDALDMSDADRGKVRDVATVPRSSYTPPRTPAFMQDYFSDDLVPASVTADVIPSDVVNPSGDSIDLEREARVLLGLERPPPPVAAPRAATPHPRAAPRPGTPQPRAASRVDTPTATGTPVIVHMMAGGTQRGQVEGFDPSSGHLQMKMKNGQVSNITLDDVLAIFFGQRRGANSPDPTGTSLIVKLVNDRQVSGMSPDYQEGADALTVVPNPRRGNIDHIWVPAWAVKAIELA